MIQSKAQKDILIMSLNLMSEEGGHSRSVHNLIVYENIWASIIKNFDTKRNTPNQNLYMICIHISCQKGSNWSQES